MQTLSSALSCNVMVRLGVYLENRLAGDARTKDLAPAIKNRTDALRLAWRGRQEAQETLVRVEASVDAADHNLNTCIQNFCDALYNDCGKNKDNPRYRKILPNGAGQFIQPRLFEQVDSTEKLLRNCDGAADDPMVKQHRPIIEKCQSALRNDLEPLRNTVGMVEKARSTEYLARVSFASTYTSTHGAVAKQVGSMWEADAFFVRYGGETIETVGTGSWVSPSGQN